MVIFALTKDTPYLALVGELRGVFHELYEEKWPWYIESALYMLPYGITRLYVCTSVITDIQW